jgi:PEP-CTERM motif
MIVLRECRDKNVIGPLRPDMNIQEGIFMKTAVQKSLHSKVLSGLFTLTALLTAQLTALAAPIISTGGNWAVSCSPTPALDIPCTNGRLRGGITNGGRNSSDSYSFTDNFPVSSGFGVPFVTVSQSASFSASASANSGKAGAFTSFTQTLLDLGSAGASTPGASAGAFFGDELTISGVSKVRRQIIIGGHFGGSLGDLGGVGPLPFGNFAVTGSFADAGFGLSVDTNIGTGDLSPFAITRTRVDFRRNLSDPNPSPADDSFQLVFEVESGNILTTTGVLGVSASVNGYADFRSTASIDYIIAPFDIDIISNAGRLVRQNDRFVYANDVVDPPPPPPPNGTVPEPATWLLMLAGLALCVLRACKRQPSKWETMRLAKQTMGALGKFGVVGALGLAASWGAHATVLNFSGLACTGAPGFLVDRTCTSGDPFGRDYGDSAGVNVFYDSANDRGSAATAFLQGLYYTDGAVYGNLVDALHGIVPGYLPRIGLYALPGYNVTLTGFDLASNQQASDTRFRIYDYNFNLLLDSGDVQIAGFGQTRTNFNVGLTSGFTVVGSPQALIFELDNINGYVALDNLNFSFAQAPSSVPEPGSLLLFGVGLMGLIRSVRRRK